ncbi:hypothetical protein [Victivallis sp. Marseille-Q1083]|uniref:hypothetical protein n=1 Tax=Victivallis sp. Marseille-Q1083 TaxID=2717288 RepID=UPI001589CB05|nr:hypothetical protein [Victivallis sp. Marseille-Q1083]
MISSQKIDYDWHALESRFTLLPSLPGKALEAIAVEAPTTRDGLPPSVSVARLTDWPAGTDHPEIFVYSMSTNGKHTA